MAKTLRNIESICRLCLGEDEKLLIPASEVINDSLSAQDIERFTGIQILQNECITYAICVDCSENLKSSNAFRTLCMTNDSLFTQMFALLVEGTSSKAGPDETSDACEVEEPCDSDINIEILDTIDPEENSCPRAEYVFHESVLISDAEPEEGYDHTTNSSQKEGDQNCNSNLGSYLSHDELDDPGGSTKDLERHATRNQSSPSTAQRNYKRCGECGKLVSDLKSHMMSHTQERNYSCPYCSLQMTLKSNLQHHIQYVHLKNTSKTCSLCGETFASYYAYKYHKASQHGDQKNETECNICSKKFANITSYNIHYGRYHATGDEKNRPKARKKQLCGECGAMVTQLSTHILTHSQEKHLACPHCPIKMADKGNLLRHIQAVHLKKVVRTCETCGKEFLHVNLYKYHMLSVHGIGKTFDCDVCVKKFKTLAGLKIHKVSLHSNEKRFECGTCGMMFKLKHTLRTHEKRVHSAEKPFACSLCPKRFKSPYGKKSHELTHSGQVFVCTMCEKSYRYKSLLQTHIKKQHSNTEEINVEH